MNVIRTHFLSGHCSTKSFGFLWVFSFPPSCLHMYSELIGIYWDTALVAKPNNVYAPSLQNEILFAYCIF